MSANPIPSPQSDQPVAPAEDATRTPAELKYEIADDILARQVFQKISAEAKARRRAEEFIRERYRWAQECGLPEATLTPEELDYVAPYLDVVRIDAAEEAFVRTAQRRLQGNRRRKAILRGTGFGLLAILAMGIGFALWYPRNDTGQPDNRRTEIAPPETEPVPSATVGFGRPSGTDEPDQSAEDRKALPANDDQDRSRTAMAAPQTAAQASPSVSTGVAPPSGTKESDPSVESGQTPQPLQAPMLAAKNARAAADASIRSDAADAAVLARFRAVLHEHREALNAAGERTAVESRIRALEDLVDLADKADALAGSASASLVEKRQADLTYVSRARQVRGSGADLKRISNRIADWDALLGRHGTVLRVAMCVQRKGLFCETSASSLAFRTGTKIFATVSLVARASHQPVTFKWLRNGSVEREESHTVEHSDSRGFRINGMMRPQRPGNWEFRVYNEIGGLITRVPFTVQ